jgi:hypothetical protein
MPTPIILVDGAAPPPLGSESNGTFDLSDTVNLSVSNHAQFGSIHWVIESKPANATAALGSSDPASPYATTFGPLDIEGTYLLRAEGNGNGATEYARVAISVLTKAGQLRVPALGEETNWDTTNGWATAYSKLAGFVDRGNGMSSIAMADANQTLTKAQYAKKTIKATGSITTTRNLIFPLIEGASWNIINATSSALPILAGGTTGTKVVIPAGVGKRIFCDGINFFTAPDVTLSGFTGIASLPAGQPGRIMVDATSVVPMYVDDGTQWRPVLGGSLGYVPPSVSAFTWTNQDTSTATDRGGTIELTTDTPSGLSLLTKAIPSSPYTVTACFRIGHLKIGDAVEFGICLKSSGSDFVTLGLATDVTGVTNIKSENYDDYATYDSTNFDSPLPVLGELIWLQFVDDGVDRIYKYSLDGRNFGRIASQTRTNFITPTAVGIFIADPASQLPVVSIVSWKES